MNKVKLLMKKSSHSKIKNTAILFELLTRQIAEDAIDSKHSAAMSILKEGFKKNSLLYKELSYYNALMQSKFNSETKADYLITATLEARKRIDERLLKREKYNLIKSINEHFNADFFDHKISQYKQYASIYRLFESAHNEIMPSEVAEAKFAILENITSVPKAPIRSLLEDVQMPQDKDLRTLTQRILLNKFNTKYAALSEDQKSILSQYITFTKAKDLKNFVINESKKLGEELKTQIANSTDKILKVKLLEVAKILRKNETLTSVNENQILSLLLYHELIKEITSK